MGSEGSRASTRARLFLAVLMRIDSHIPIFIKSAFPSVGYEGFFAVNGVGMKLLMLWVSSRHLEVDQAPRLRGLYDGV